MASLLSWPVPETLGDVFKSKTLSTVATRDLKEPLLLPSVLFDTVQFLSLEHLFKKKKLQKIHPKQEKFKN